jgi:hypothetical protein
MPRTSEDVLAEQQRIADAELQHRLATRGPMPAGLSPLQQTQFRLWGWWDIRRQSNHGKHSFEEHRSGAAARVVPPVTPNRTSATVNQRRNTNVQST